MQKMMPRNFDCPESGERCIERVSTKFVRATVPRDRWKSVSRHESNRALMIAWFRKRREAEQRAPERAGAQPSGCRDSITLLLYRRRRSWIDRLPRPLDTADDARAPNPSASSFVVADQTLPRTRDAALSGSIARDRSSGVNRFHQSATCVGPGHGLFETVFHCPTRRLERGVKFVAGIASGDS
jgi:hypothetical protein